MKSISNFSLKWGLTWLLAVVMPVLGLVALLPMVGTFLKCVVAADMQSSLPFLVIYGLILLVIICKSQFIYYALF